MIDHALAPAKDVFVRQGEFWSESNEPWLQLRAIEAFPPGRTVLVRYSIGACDDVVRPILRFVDSHGRAHDALLPAAAFGAGEWLGRVPNDVARIEISPVASPGPFSFRIEEVRAAPLKARLARAAASPKRVFFAKSARMVRLHAEADLNHRWVYGRADTQDFHVWRKRRSLVRARADGRDVPRVVVGLIGEGDSRALDATLASLQAQTAGGWRLRLVAPSRPQQDWLDALREPATDAVARLQDVAHEGFVALLAPGDRLAPNAVACLRSQIWRRPETVLAYADEVRTDARGRATPVFKPDWSPVRETHAPYLGRAAFVRADVFAHVCDTGSSPEALVRRVALEARFDAVAHMRRALFETHGARTDAHWAPPAQARARHPRVGIVMPTRDRLDLLEPALRSALQTTDYPNFEIVVVDNDSVEPRTLETLYAMRNADRRLSIVHAPGPFNFSVLSNQGARATDAEFLLFLNNDTEVLQPDWISNLLQFAEAPDVGAVGAKLLYPNGRVQHAGVVVGLGGVAGHFGDGREADAPGWLGSGLVPHEASAVTGACLMVERRKFEAVGGFDEANLPVDLNDIDLCLRLAERGWRTICDCRTTLVHHQAASRGKPLLLQRVYQKERDYFRQRWRAIIRDDPYFNPSLSLYAHKPKLA